MENNSHWRSKVEIFQCTGLHDLQEAINDFCKDKFVVGIQYPEALKTEKNFPVVISYKVKDESLQ